MRSWSWGMLLAELVMADEDGFRFEHVWIQCWFGLLAWRKWLTFHRRILQGFRSVVQACATVAFLCVDVIVQMRYIFKLNCLDRCNVKARLSNHSQYTALVKPEPRENTESRSYAGETKS